MTVPPTLPVTLLIRSVQRRLWIESLWECERRAAWLSAGVVLGGGAWHLALRAHAGAWTAAGALAVLAVPLVVTLLAGRPPTAEAARRADAWFDGKELITSAVDQLARPLAARAGTAEFVVARASAAALAWRERLAARPLRLGLRRLAGPLALALVGGFLHLLPGREARETSAPRTAPAAVAVAPTADPLAWSRPADPSAVGARPGPPSAPTSDAVAAADEPPSIVPGGVAVPGTGRLPGGAAPRDALHRPSDAGPLGASFVDLPRAAGDAADASGAVALRGDAPAAPGSVPGAAPRAEAVDVDARDDMSPALRAYVAAYLRRQAEAR